MKKYISVEEATIALDTTNRVIWVTACVYRKKYGEYPCWYTSNGRSALIDIDYLIKLRDREMNLHLESIELYYFIHDEMKINNSELSRILVEKSEIYDKYSSWLAFMQHTLFCEPMMKFHDRVTRLSEFHRIATIMKMGL